MLAASPFVTRRAAALATLAVASVCAISALLPAAAQAAVTDGHPLTGIVEAAGPVRGATVVLRRTDGRVFARVAGRTNRRGVFTIRLRTAPPARYTVEATGGRDHRGLLRGRLLSNHTSRNRFAPLIVNSATTLSAIYHRARPGITHATAEAHVRRYLGLPRRVDLRVDLTHNSSEFHGHAFHVAAGGHTERYARTLVDDIRRGERREYLPSARALAASDARDARARSARAGVVTTSDLFTNDNFIRGTSALVSKVTESSAAGQVFGALLGAIIGTTPDPTLVQLQIINQKLDDLQNSLDRSIRLQQEAARKADFNAYGTATAGGSLPQIEGAAREAWILYSEAVRKKLDATNAAAGSPAAVSAAEAQGAFLSYYADGPGTVSAAGSTLLNGMSTLATFMNKTDGNSPLRLWRTALLNDRYMTASEANQFFDAYEYWRVLHAHLLVMNLEYAQSDQGAAKRGLVPLWISQYSRSGQYGQFEGAAMTSWENNAGTVQITRRLVGSQVWDNATSLLWNPVDQGAGKSPYVTFPTAQAQAVAPFALPTPSQWNSLLRPTDKYLGMSEKGFTTAGPYLRAQAFPLNSVCEGDQQGTLRAWWSTRYNSGNVNVFDPTKGIQAEDRFIQWDLPGASLCVMTVANANSGRPVPSD